MERRCQRKPTPKLPNTTRTPPRHIVRRRSITGKANTIRATRSQPRLTNIPPQLIVTQPSPTGRVANTEPRNSPLLPRGSDAPAFRGKSFSEPTPVLAGPQQTSHNQFRRGLSRPNPRLSD